MSDRDRRVARKAVRALAGTALVVAVILAGLAVAGRPRTATPAPQVPTGSASVTRGPVTERVEVAGVLGFAGLYHVVHLGPPGVLTALPAPGTTISRGGVLYAVDNKPVRLLYGGLPAYRDLEFGMSAGPDVLQLERNLSILGVDPGRVDVRFSRQTARAIRRWQAAHRLPLGKVVFLPGPLRVTEVRAIAGTRLGPSDVVMTLTQTRRVVTTRLTTDRQHLIRINDQVWVSSSGVAPLTGRVSWVGRVAAAPATRDNAAGEPATVPVTISVTLPRGSPDLDQAPVQVAITTQTHPNVLMVPVAALLARPGGGYQVRRASSSYVEVRPGLFDAAAGTVEVAGDLSEGDLVEVPAR